MRFILKTDYDQDVRLFRHGGDVFWYGLLLVLLAAAPVLLTPFYLGELTFMVIYAIVGAALVLLVGFTGQVSLGQAAFLAIGAYAHVWFLNQGVPLPVSLLLASGVSAAMGTLLGLVALRMTGIYLAIATLAFSVLVEKGIGLWEPVTGGYRGMPVSAPQLFGITLSQPWQFYFLCLAAVVLVMVGVLNLMRSPTGRAFIAIRDSEISAQSLGVHISRYKTLAFAVSSGITGLAGGLLAHRLGFLAPDAFTFVLSIQLLLMVVVGGLESLKGAAFGAVFIVVLPQKIALVRDRLPELVAQTPGLEAGLSGLILVLFIIFDPGGLYGRWVKIRLYFNLFPLYRRATFRRQRSYLKTGRLR